MIPTDKVLRVPAPLDTSESHVEEIERKGIPRFTGIFFFIDFLWFSLALASSLRLDLYTATRGTLTGINGAEWKRLVELLKEAGCELKVK